MPVVPLIIVGIEYDSEMMKISDYDSHLPEEASGSSRSVYNYSIEYVIIWSIL